MADADTTPPSDPRVAALYDVDNPPGADHDWFRALAGAAGARTVVDLGCGTGSLTVTLALPGRTVTGVDPDAAMLDVARSRPGAERVTWVEGDSRAIGDARADLVVLSGNVAQHVLGEAWTRTLADVHDGLRPGGVVAFESRDPDARAWLAWDREHTLGTRPTPDGPLTEWLDVVAVTDDGHVTFEAHNVFAATGEHLVVRQTLAFRSQERLTADLAAAGLAVRSVHGGWRGEPAGGGARLLVVAATRAG